MGCVDAAVGAGCAVVAVGEAAAGAGALSVPEGAVAGVEEPAASGAFGAVLEVGSAGEAEVDGAGGQGGGGGGMGVITETAGSSVVMRSAWETRLWRRSSSAAFRVVVGSGKVRERVPLARN